MDTSEESGWGPLPDQEGSTCIGSFGPPSSQPAPPCQRWGLGAVPLSADTSLVSEPDVEEEDDCPEKYQECTDASGFFATQWSPEEYKKQTTEYTKEAVDALIRSPEYQRRYTTCRLCWSIWSDGRFGDSCAECGGYAMQRPCPICGGKCDRIWDRDVDMSHSNNEAFWDGECGLPPGEQTSHLTQMVLATADDDTVLDAMELLSAG